MDKQAIEMAVFSLENKSFPQCGRPSGTVTETINGKKVKAETRWNRGNISRGKGATTRFYVEGQRVAKAKLADVIAA